jgi:ribonuclease Y
MLEVLVVATIALGLGGLLGFWLFPKVWKAKEKGLRRQAEGLLQEARHRADQLLKEAEITKKSLLIKAKEDFEKEISQRHQELVSLEKKLLQRQEHLERKVEQIEKREYDILKQERELRSRGKSLETKEEELAELKKSIMDRLEEVSGMTREEAKQRVLEAVTEEARMEASKVAKEILDEAQADATKKAKMIIGLAIQRYAGEYTQERTVSVVDLPSNDMKGRIIGREGRNIRAIEAATAVDVIVDDTPDAVILSSHNPIRREIARLSLEKLVADGRIHPARIEEVVKKTEEEMEKMILDAGQNALFELGIQSIHPELVRYLGMLKYRTSYAQNVLSHSVEAAYICSIMAAELGLDVKIAKRAAVLHDIGKAVSHEVEGQHALIGADLARRYGESAEIVHGIEGHHEEVPIQSIWPILVQAADAISGARPGARKETYEHYIKRLETLEKVALGFDGIEKAYALQAGRELRVVVHSVMVNDAKTAMLAREIAKKIESELTYPGKIKVTVIREVRAIEHAK